jgi:hypothetical protein
MYLSLVGYPPCRQATSPGVDETSWSTETTSPGRIFVLVLIPLSFSCFCLHCFLHILEAMQSLQSGGLWQCLSILLKIDEMPFGRCFCFAMCSMIENEAWLSLLCQCMYSWMLSSKVGWLPNLSSSSSKVTRRGLVLSPFD